MSSRGLILSSLPILSGIQIQNAGLRDMQAIQAIERESYLQDIYPFLEVLGMLTLPGIVRLKATVDDTLAGFIFAEGFSDSQYDWITAIRVSQAYQRQGIGTMLLARCEERMKKDILRLCVRSSNHPAIQLYLKYGFKEVTIWQRYYNDGENAIVMEKKH